MDRRNMIVLIQPLDNSKTPSKYNVSISGCHNQTMLEVKFSCA